MKININNIDKINKAFETIQVRCSARLCDFSDVSQAVQTIERRLNALKICKKNWQDMMFFCSPYTDGFPNAYKGTPDGTTFKLTRGSSSWFITQINRQSCNGNSKNAIQFINIDDYKQFIQW